MPTAAKVIKEIYLLPVKEREKVARHIIEFGIKGAHYDLPEILDIKEWQDEIAKKPFNLKQAAEYLGVSSVTLRRLTLATPDAYERLGTRAQMNPPLRDRAHQDQLWWGLSQGVVDVLGSDHAPHTLEEKAGTYPATPSGMPGVQTLVPVMLDHVNAGRLSLARFVDLTSAGPQRIFGIAGKGRIAVGYDADLTIVDLKAERAIEEAWIGSKCGWTPFAGRRVQGWPAGTVVRGQLAMWEGELSEARGEPVRFGEALPQAEAGY